MSKLLGFMEFVKGQASFHENMAEKTKHDKANPKRSPKHQKTAQDFHGLAAAMVEAQAELEAAKGAAAALAPVPPSVDPQQSALTLRPEDLAGLPPELLKQLK